MKRRRWQGDPGDKQDKKKPVLYCDLLGYPNYIHVEKVAHILTSLFCLSFPVNLFNPFRSVKCSMLCSGWMCRIVSSEVGVGRFEETIEKEKEWQGNKERVLSRILIRPFAIDPGSHWWQAFLAIWTKAHSSGCCNHIVVVVVIVVGVGFVRTIN